MSITDGIRKNVDLQHPQFFVSHTEKLSALLLVVSAEASVTSDPEALCDYLELTEILASLLEEAQLCSILSADDIRAREHQVLSFLDKIQTVQEAVADWDPCTSASANSSSRKRARSNDFEAETTGASKRRRAIESEQILVTEPALNGPFARVVPSMEDSPCQWWTEPFCD